MKILNRIFFQPTFQCNLRCRYCYFGGTLEKRDGTDFSYVVRAAKLLAKKFKDGGYLTRHIIHHGGEPTVIPPEILAATCNALQPIVAEGGGQGVQTNGTLIDAAYMDAFEAVVDPAVSLVASVSLDGPEEITDPQRGTGTYQKAFGNALMLKDRGHKVNLFGCVTPFTLRSLPALEKWVRETHAQGFGWKFQLGAPPHNLSEEQQKSFAHWLFERDLQSLFLVLSPGVCSSYGNECFLLRFNADGELPLCGCDRAPGQYRAGWKSQELGEIIGMRQGYFSDFPVAAKCSYCPILPVCNSGCPVTRVDGRAHECTLRRTIFELEAQKQGVPVRKVLNIYRSR